jgi:23S rRNA pseudouridine2457 synthase
MVISCISDSMSKKYFAFHKPYNVLCQFTKEQPDDITLADFLKIPSDVYPVGRLDKDSEGLLLLSNDSKFIETLLSPEKSVKKKYAVLVEGLPDQVKLNQLQNGVKIKLKNSVYQTKPCKASFYQLPDNLKGIGKPVRVRKEIPETWIQIELKEGKNRQIRKMCASIGHPVLRLIRITIGDIHLGELKPGDYIEIGKSQLI